MSTSVDHVDDAIAGRNIRLHDVRLPYFHLSGVRLDRKFLTIYRLGIGGDHIGCHDLARDDMVGKNGYQTLLIFRLEQILDGAFWQFGKSFVGGCKDREWPFSVQSFHQSRSLDSSDKRVELPCVGSDGDNGFLFG